MFVPQSQWCVEHGFSYGSPISGACCRKAQAVNIGQSCPEKAWRVVGKWCHKHGFRSYHQEDCCRACRWKAAVIW